MAFRCPHARQVVGMDILTCQKMMQEGKVYRTPADHLEIYCPYQSFCGVTRRNENTEEAKKCKILTKAGT